MSSKKQQSRCTNVQPHYRMKSRCAESQRRLWFWITDQEMRFTVQCIVHESTNGDILGSWHCGLHYIQSVQTEPLMVSMKSNQSVKRSRLLLVCASKTVQSHLDYDPIVCYAFDSAVPSHIQGFLIIERRCTNAYITAFCQCRMRWVGANASIIVQNELMMAIGHWMAHVDGAQF